MHSPREGTHPERALLKFLKCYRTWDTQLSAGDSHIHNKDSESGVHDLLSEEHPYQSPDEGLRDLKLGVSLGPGALLDSAELSP